MLIFDMGGGTFDVSMLHIVNGVITVLATNGDSHLGGEDIDNLIVQHCMVEFKLKNGVDIKNNSRALARLKIEVEKAKRQLSTSHEGIRIGA